MVAPASKGESQDSGLPQHTQPQRRATPRTLPAACARCQAHATRGVHGHICRHRHAYLGLDDCSSAGELHLHICCSSCIRPHAVCSVASIGAAWYRPRCTTAAAAAAWQHLVHHQRGPSDHTPQSDLLQMQPQSYQCCFQTLVTHLTELPTCDSRARSSHD